MGLDIRTILVVIAILFLMLSGFLALAGRQAAGIRGIRHWSAANLCFGLALGQAYFVTILTPGYLWAVVAANALLAAGLALEYEGIRAFTGQASRAGSCAAYVATAVLVNVWFVAVHEDSNARAIGNSIALGLGHLACARALLIRIEPPLRTAYWFTGSAFALLMGMMLLRITAILTYPPGTYSLYQSLPINPATLFIAVILQFCVTFGFVLMIDYRLIVDMQTLAWEDPLTGAFTRRRLEDEAGRLLARCRRTGDVLALMMLDVDRFKAINDRHGHPFGDEVLRRLAGHVTGSIRLDDYFARYGGEEFCILLPSTTVAEAAVMAERLRASYEAMTLEHGGQKVKSTVSIGLADTQESGLDFDALVAAADRALYRAKQEGRNRVAVGGMAA